MDGLVENICSPVNFSYHDRSYIYIYIYIERERERERERTYVHVGHTYTLLVILYCALSYHMYFVYFI